MFYTAGEATGAEVGLKVENKTVKPPKQIIIPPEERGKNIKQSQTIYINTLKYQDIKMKHTEVTRY